MDISLSKDLNIISGKGELYDNPHWYHIYSRSNEKVKELFERINVDNKDILTVLSSSDYLFSCLVNNIKSIETFDINSLTYRYYFLRKWLIENNYIDAEWLDYEIIENIISEKLKSSNKEIQESAYFWYYYLKKNKFLNIYSQPIFDNPLRPKTIYDDKLSILKEKLDDYEIKYYNTDIIYSDINKKYDVILLSNILDYCYTKGDLLSIKNVLRNLLNDNGEVVCNQMIYHSLTLEDQNELLSDIFEYEEIFSHVAFDYKFTYYKYIKK